MIIALSGRMGSGKDTVGKIIQYLLCHNVGDVSIEDVLSCNEHDWWLEEQSNSEIKKFAGKLKAIGSILSGVPVEKFEDQEFKKLNMGSDWDHELVGEDWVDLKPVLVPMTYREFLQKLGTEAMRDGLHTNVWVNALFADYIPHKKEGGFQRSVKDTNGIPYDFEYEVEYPNWIITDMRFPNELESVVERQGITIRVTRPVEKSKTTARLHPSETALDKAIFDYEIVNSGSIENLVDMVREILTRESIL